MNISYFPYYSYNPEINPSQLLVISLGIKLSLSTTQYFHKPSHAQIIITLNSFPRGHHAHLYISSAVKYTRPRQAIWSLYIYIYVRLFSACLNRRMGLLNSLMEHCHGFYGAHTTCRAGVIVVNVWMV